MPRHVPTATTTNKELETNMTDDTLPDPLPLCTRPEIAWALGVNSWTVAHWENELPPLPVAQPGGPGKASRYSLRAVFAWYLERELRRPRNLRRWPVKDTKPDAPKTAVVEAVRQIAPREGGSEVHTGREKQSREGPSRRFEAIRGRGETNEHTNNRPASIAIGYVSMVNGADAVTVPGFVASRHEPLVLAKHWALEKLDISYVMFRFGYVGGSELRSGTFAEMRIERIADALNDDSAIKKAIDEAREEFSKNWKDSLGWKVFMGKATPDEEAQWNVEYERIRSEGGF
jgi:hypothetical protein